MINNKNGSLVFNTLKAPVKVSLGAFHRKLSKQFTVLNSKPTAKGSVIHYGYKRHGQMIKAYEEVYNAKGELRFINHIEKQVIDEPK